MSVLHTAFTISMKEIHPSPKTHKLPIKAKVFRISLALAGGTAVLVMAVLATNVLWAMAVPIPEFGQLQNTQARESTKIYDRSGKILLYDTSGSMRQVSVPLEDISPYLVSATIAIEDDSFYEHSGIKPSAIFRAIIANLQDITFSQGGSTITQQVIKNTLLTRDKKITRKVKEWILAMRIERIYTKDEILETYFNETPYGGTLYGVEEASHAYFGKSAKDITLLEAAYLASLPKAPTYYSPWGQNKDRLTERSFLVLQAMLDHGMITKEEYDTARAEKVTFTARGNETIRAPHFVFYVLDELEKKYGTEAVFEEGLQVVTTLDWDLQQKSEEIVQKKGLENEKNFNASNAGLVALDPRSGQVLAMVGSRDYFNNEIEGQVNVTTALRQPGSSFKPFVYATAFEKGYTPETTLYDVKTQFSTACAPSNLSNEYPCYAPDNYDSQFKGKLSMREGLAQSSNIIGVKALYLGGINQSIETARDMGITTLEDSSRYGLTLVLGGGEVTLLEMTAAYGVFSQDGVKHETTPFLSVRNMKGKVLDEYADASKEVLDPEVARMINDILSDNQARTPAFGAQSPLYFGDEPVASKTGTTNDYKDMWVIGYTPSIVVGAWTGNNNNEPMIKRTSAFVLAPMWREVMLTAMEHSPTDVAFTPPRETQSVPTLAAAQGMFNFHEILYWVDKDNPKGSQPTDPYSDPQLALWEYPVLMWYVGQLASSTFAGDFGLGTGGRDDSSADMRVVASNRNIRANETFTASINHSEIENVTGVYYYVDGEFVGKADTAPFSIPISIEDEGRVTLKAVAESPLGFAEATTNINVRQARRVPVGG